ncbi:T9SS type B sorting domain-containing protein [Niastella vici]|uniref:T9SS type B sorting domain-containing protein n=1 Tax=Niastella vici TaxID=1703345 RepID=UPI0009C0CEBF|nr:T9SS type B sorting domain-containing protein [Niastella vici]
MKYFLCIAVIIIAVPGFSQTHTCPTNINFNTGDLSNWAAATGLVKGAKINYPAPNTGVSSINEYAISKTGIRVITSAGTDPYGGFTTIPAINGYSYNYSIQLGSTANSHDYNSQQSNPGGFTSSVTYTINVPAGSTTDAYTMTYAYAMVLENGTHNSNEQPLFKATLSTGDSVITCASPSYYLPTLNNGTNTGGGSTQGATLDTAKAIANGFTNSAVPFLSYSGTNNVNGTWLYDVWTKGWTEVTFDLAPYRGKQVTLTFEADNCAAGAHFAYAYIALRNTCAGLEISGETAACINSTVTYSVPALAGATYNWEVPAGWTIVSGANTNIITATIGATDGNVINHEVNGCADLRDTIAVTTTPATVPGQVKGDTAICSGINRATLTLSGETGNVLKWLSSTDGVNWQEIAITADNYTAQDLTTTTHYLAVVQNGRSCSIDTSSAATVIVDAKADAGELEPGNTNVCAGQAISPTLTLTNYTGAVVNWQLSYDSVSWADFSPVYQDTSYNTGNVTQTIFYRTIVKSGVCPLDTSNVAVTHFFNANMPAATIDPDSAIICYGKPAILNTTITAGTSYTWSNTAILTGTGDGVIPSLPYTMRTTATPLVTTDVVLSVYNTGCPNEFRDTFHIEVTLPIIVDAGNDTSVVINQPLQLTTTVNNRDANLFKWTPATGLNHDNIYNPVATYIANTLEYITYIVSATTAAGCAGYDTVTVRVFKTGANIFVPSAFTPNGDGHNDVIRPVLVGIGQLNFFRIYNRWGQLVFSTNQVGKGWDGNVGGNRQSTENFVYMVQGVDYNGKVVNQKGNIILIR